MQYPVGSFPVHLTLGKYSRGSCWASQYLHYTVQYSAVWQLAMFFRSLFVRTLLFSILRLIVVIHYMLLWNAELFKALILWQCSTLLVTGWITKLLLRKWLNPIMIYNQWPKFLRCFLSHRPFKRYILTRSASKMHPCTWII